MSNWISIMYGLIILGLIIAVHEFGHFIVAKKNGIQVVDFSIGMGPVLWSKVRNGTRYCLRAIPFGGACQMLGDDNGIPDPEIAATKNNQSSFLAKPVWVRIAVIFAGPFFNFLLAFVMAVIVLGIAGVDKPVLLAPIEGYPAEAAGIQEGDQIRKLNSTSITTARDISLFFDEYKAGSDLDITVLRDGKLLSFHVTPKLNEETNQYQVGISWSLRRQKVGVVQTLGYAMYEVAYWIRLTFKSLGMLFTGQVTVNDMSGPVGIVDIVDDTVEASKQDGALYIFLNLANLTILLSANVGVMNLLPIPALDGGRLFFLLIEAVRRKPIDRTKEGYVHIAGFLLLFLLMIVVLFNDLRRMFKG